MVNVTLLVLGGSFFYAFLWLLGVFYRGYFRCSPESCHVSDDGPIVCMLWVLHHCLMIACHMHMWLLLLVRHLCWFCGMPSDVAAL